MKYYFKIFFYLFTAVYFSSAFADDKVDFFRAVNVDNASGVSKLLAAGFDPNTANDAGQRGLHLAFREESLKAADALLADARTDVNAANGSDETPLMMAALRGQHAFAVKLLERGAQLNRAGWTPLHYAASGPEVKVVALLLDRGAAIEAPSPNRTTPLMMAARYGAEESALLLLARGASTTARNDKGLNAADFARLGGRQSLAQRLEPQAR